MAAVTRIAPTFLVATDAPVLKVMTWRVITGHVKVPIVNQLLHPHNII